MNIRNVEIAILPDFECEVSETADNKLKLIFRGEYAPDNTFAPSQKWKNIFIRFVERDEIIGGFKVSTFAQFKNFKFQVDRFQNGKYRLSTSDEKAYKELNLHMVDRGWYDIEVSPGEIERMWEERKPSGYGFPFPEGMKEVEEIDFRRNT